MIMIMSESCLSLALVARTYNSITSLKVRQLCFSWTAPTNLRAAGLFAHYPLPEKSVELALSAALFQYLWPTGAYAR